MMMRKSILHSHRASGETNFSMHSDYSLGVHYEYVPNDVTSKVPAVAPAQQDGDQIPDGLDVKDMFTATYDNKTIISIWKVVLAAVLGVGTGILLGELHVDLRVGYWIQLPGRLFVHALQCLIVPMVFFSAVSCVAELVEAGKVISVGSRTVMYFALSSLVSSAIGTGFGYLSKDLYKSLGIVRAVYPVGVAFRCANGNFLSLSQEDGVACGSSNITESMFVLNDTNSVYQLTRQPYVNLDVTDQIFNILYDLIPDNIFEAFATGSTLSVISFGFMFGAAIIQTVDKQSDNANYVLLLVTQANLIFRMLINFVVAYIPLAVFSIIAGALSGLSSSARVLGSVGWFILFLAAALVTLTIGVMGVVLFVTTRRNIFSYLQHMIPAQKFIVGCSSSIATLPMTMRCVDSTHEVPHSLSRFILSIGATSNLNGTAVYMPMACIFLAQVAGYGELLTPLRYCLLAIVGAIASFGVAAVPHSGLVMVVPVWQTVFGMADVPSAFSLLVGIDWILNRMTSVVNITNDAVIARIIAHQCGDKSTSEMTGRADSSIRSDL